MTQPDKKSNKSARAKRRKPVPSILKYYKETDKQVQQAGEAYPAPAVYPCVLR